MLASTFDLIQISYYLLYHKEHKEKTCASFLTEYFDKTTDLPSTIGQDFDRKKKVNYAIQISR